MASYEEDYDAVAASEDEHDCVDEDDYIMVFPTAPPTSTLLAASGADTSSSSPPTNAHAEEEQMPPPPLSSSTAASSPCVEPDTADVAAAEVEACDMIATAAAAAGVEASDMIAMAAAAGVEARDMVAMAFAAAELNGVVAAAAPPRAAWRIKHGARGGWAGAEADEEEATDDEEDEEDYMYQAYYDRADKGRSRHVKRSSGRRGRTKKASTMGRPRGEGHLSHTAGGHAYAYAY